jgi:hypothetical protein
VDEALPAGEQVVNCQEHDRAQDGRCKPDRIFRLENIHCDAEILSEQSSGNPEHRGDEQSSRVSAGHEEFGDEPDEESDNDGKNDMHNMLSNLELCPCGRPLSSCAGSNFPPLLVGR